ncbi:MAG: DUF1592 domain-containing protein [Fuerstiella sp.]
MPQSNVTTKFSNGHKPANAAWSWRPALIGFGGVMTVSVVLMGLWFVLKAETIAGIPMRYGEGEGTSNTILASLRNPVAADSAAEILAQEKAARTDTLQHLVLPFLNSYCTDCHGADTQEGGISVHRLQSVDQLLSERKTWQRVYRMINAGAMPPADHDPSPPLDEQQKVAEFLYDELHNFDCDLVYNPGRPTVQRLNRTEYNNTVQDLFGIDLLPAADFPADDVGEGFDNIGDVLSLPPLLLEKYLNAAEEVAAAVIDTTDYSKPLSFTTTADQLQGGRMSGDSRWLVSAGEIFGTFDLPATGDYEILVVASATQMDKERARFALRHGKELLGEFDVQKDRTNETFQHRVRLDAGNVRLATAFLNDAYDPEAGEDRNFAVHSIAVHGPIGDGIVAYTEVHKRFVTARPGDNLDVTAAARLVLRPILDRAFRRPVTEEQLNRYAALVRMTVDEMGETYEVGLSMALQAMLVAPDFLFRLEREPEPGQSERRLDDFELASRLSYFLWSSMPDDELFALAGRDELGKPETLRQQIHRMLQDDRAEALVDNFAAQWLNLRNLEEVSPNTDIFKSFNNELKVDMRRETELLFRTVMREDRSIEDLLSADFTFVNKRLAEHYGIKGVKTDEFERVSLAGTNRSGVLTHASILTLTSNPGRTSPVKRGKWIMENIFGEAPPPPPPGVPDLEETTQAAPDATLREQLAKHREDPGCAACHKLMDPLGLGFENFNAIGQWRTMEDGKTIDASGNLPSGEAFDGPLELISIVRNRRGDFFRTMSEKMLVYAIGRGAEYYDKCTVDQCLEVLHKRGHRFSALVEAIVLSDPFLKKRAATTSITQK